MKRKKSKEKKIVDIYIKWGQISDLIMRHYSDKTFTKTCRVGSGYIISSSPFLPGKLMVLVLCASGREPVVQVSLCLNTQRGMPV